MTELGPDISHNVLTALRDYAQEAQLRAQAPDADLRVGKVIVSSVIALDLADLVADRDADRRRLQELRATDQIFTKLRSALKDDHGQLVGPDLRQRMNRAVAKKGKRVWTDHFVERFTPFLLEDHVRVWHGGHEIPLLGRLETLDAAPLHFVRLTGAKLQLFRDGTLCYTLETEIINHLDGPGVSEPAKVDQIIERLDKLNEAAHENFRKVIRNFVQNSALQESLTEHLGGLSFKDDPDEKDVARRAKAHTVVFVERFFDGKMIRNLYADDGYHGQNDDQAAVPLHTALASSALAGLLNTASWYQHYNSRYVSKLSSKEIGYRDDEIYLTDRKATIASTKGFWRSADPLSEYRQDIVLAVEYNVARLAYLAATLSYYQDHPDVHTIENEDPGAALPTVLNGRAILTQLEESLDLTLLIDHGFTRLFVERLRQELGFRTAIGYIRQRIDDASTSVGLKSSVLAAEQTSKRTLRAGVVAAVVATGALVISAFFGYRSVHDPVKLPDAVRVCAQRQKDNALLVTRCAEPPVKPHK